MTQLQVIGAGLPRTATLSQKLALEMLGLEPCYHMVQVWSEIDVAHGWAEAFDGNANWDKLLGGYQATVDWPGGFFLNELMGVYPDAKVLLSVRDGDAWAESMRDTIWSILYGDSLMADLSSARCRVDPAWRLYIDLMKSMWQRAGLLDAEGFDPVTVSKAMEHYNQEVIRTVPSERLLVWSPAEGWEPLCSFLGVSVPQSPLPHANSRDSFVDAIVEGALATLNEWRTQRVTSTP